MAYKQTKCYSETYFKFNENGIGSFRKSFDIFGDGSIQLVSTPGHSHGLFTTLIQGKEKFIAIIGDVGYMKKSWEEMWIPGLTVDKDAATRSLKWVQSISSKRNCEAILATHDPSIGPHIIEI